MLFGSVEPHQAADVFFKKKPGSVSGSIPASLVFVSPFTLLSSLSYRQHKLPDRKEPYFEKMTTFVR